MSYPSNAVPFQFTGAPGLPTVAEMQGACLASIQNAVDRVNALRMGAFTGNCAGWTAVNTVKQKQGQLLDPKPSVPAKQVLNSEVDSATGILFAWITEDSPIAPPCPDLPVVSVSSNFAHVGVQVWNQYYQCCPDDTMPEGSTVQESRGTFIKTRFSGWMVYYVKQ